MYYEYFLSYSFLNFTNSEDNKSLESFIAAFAVVKHDHVALRERENDYIVKIFLASEQSKQPVRFAFSSIFKSTTVKLLNYDTSCFILYERRLYLFKRVEL